jgi:hypothetical protein
MGGCPLVADWCGGRLPAGQTPSRTFNGTVKPISELRRNCRMCSDDGVSAANALLDCSCGQMRGRRAF